MGYLFTYSHGHLLLLCFLTRLEFAKFLRVKEQSACVDTLSIYVVPPICFCNFSFRFLKGRCKDANKTFKYKFFERKFCQMLKSAESRQKF